MTASRAPEPMFIADVRGPIANSRDALGWDDLPTQVQAAITADAQAGAWAWRDGDVIWNVAVLDANC